MSVQVEWLKVQLEMLEERIKRLRQSSRRGELVDLLVSRQMLKKQLEFAQKKDKQEKKPKLQLVR